MKEYFKLIYTKSKKSYFNYLHTLLKNERKKFIITVNPETIIMAQRNADLEYILKDKNNSLTPDGIGIVKKARKYGYKIDERITGIDIAAYLLKEGNNLKKSIYLFGATEKVVSDLVKVINKSYPNLNVIGYSNGYVKNKDNIFKNISKLEPDIVLVAQGIPEQELLINRNINLFSKGIFVGVGGSFDVLSGHKKRTPKFFIKHNLEWLYRILKEPKRLKRFYQNNILFYLKK